MKKKNNFFENKNQVISSDFKWFTKYWYNLRNSYNSYNLPHITYITHVIYITRIIHITQNLHYSYNSHNSYNLHNLPTHTIKLNFKAFFFLYIEMVNNYYQKHKDRIQKEASERYQNLSEEKSKKKWKKDRWKISKFNWRRRRKKASISSKV